MKNLEIREVLDNVKRQSNRVKNAGNYSLFKQGKTVSNRIRRAGNINIATQLETEYKELVKKEYAELPTSISDSHNFLSMSDAYGDDSISSKNTDKNWTYKDDTIVASQEIEDKIDSIADAYNAVTGGAIVVTDGYRSEQDQANAMFNKLENGEDLEHLYKDQDAVKEIIDTYNKGVGSGDSDEKIKEDMAGTINEQAKAGTFISNHLTDKAFDVRSSGMSADQIDQFTKTVQDNGGKVIKEGDHLHVQFPS